MITCPNCKRELKPKRPNNCKCDIDSWPEIYQTGEKPFPPICDHYEHDIDSAHKSDCKHCEHDEACHE